MYKRFREISIESVMKAIIYILVIAVLGFIVYQLVILRAHVETGQLPDQGAEPNILDKLGPRTAVALIMVMVGLLAWLFGCSSILWPAAFGTWYLGPLTSDALARAEISRIEDDLREDLRKGVYAALIDITNENFRRRYRIPIADEPPNLVPGVTIDDSGNVLQSAKDWDLDLDDTSWDDEYPYHDPTSLGRMPTQREKEKIDAEKKKKKAERKKRENFRNAYRDEQLRLYREHLYKERTAARDRARALLPEIDVSSFGGGWIFVLEFTTIIFIVFTALALGFVGVLGAEHIATILASIAGYVLGKSSTFRSSGGHEIVRGAEQPTAITEAIVKQAEARVQTDEDKVNLQEQIKALKDQLAKTKSMVPNLIGKTSTEASTLLKEKDLVPETKLISNSDVEEGNVFDQSPIGDTEVQRGSSVVLFVAKKQGLPNGDLEVPPAPPEDENNADNPPS